VRQAPVRPAARIKVQPLVDEFIDVTDEMNELKGQVRKLAVRRARLALQLSDTGLYLYQIGEMVGLAAPTLCRLAQKAKEHDEREEAAAGDRHPWTG
jgi:hypothetical protein